MMHYTCDLCGEALSDQRYVAKVEVTPAFEPPQICEADLEADHLQQVADYLAQMGDNLAAASAEDEMQRREFRFDLCPRCHRRYVADPLGRERLRRLKVSPN